MSGVEIVEEHHITRYCKPRFIDGGLPIADAFQLRDKEKYLSVNWLEYFGKIELDQAVDCVRQVFRNKGYKIRVGGRFASFQIRKVKEAISRHTRLSAAVVHIPSKNDPSHCGIFGYTGQYSLDRLIALEIAKLTHADDIYPGKLP
ncbi:MAG: hypothetical protein F4100_07205 [Rhodothermaceae bacterium]|nr:hypothetical protein [Rhodothermaceae bacterium]MXW31752.1 hypothetical protein [Rhodothermaceae bacterium]MYE62930.1 hypothetical protein [Rhodothermaceae bacterium]MYJ20515.1 hypothetical protein [Rhodothermaceae bacterium]